MHNIAHWLTGIGLRTLNRVQWAEVKGQNVFICNLELSRVAHIWRTVVNHKVIVGASDQVPHQSVHELYKKNLYKTTKMNPQHFWYEINCVSISISVTACRFRDSNLMSLDSLLVGNLLEEPLKLYEFHQETHLLFFFMHC